MVAKRIDHITSELQEAIMRTRMQPIGNVLNKFPRLARDLARILGKEVALHIEGKDVELDKTLIESISDPLTHLVRNAIDHGIETPLERERAGKHPMGRISLKAFHEAGRVNIEISDDGRGLDGDLVAAAAIEKGFVTEEQARGLKDNEKIDLIFLPAFSMARAVTDLSGRGVGMDVVKTNLDRLGGQIDIDAIPGKGTTVRIKVPLTLAIIPSQDYSDRGQPLCGPPGQSGRTDPHSGRSSQKTDRTDRRRGSGPAAFQPVAADQTCRFTGNPEDLYGPSHPSKPKGPSKADCGSTIEKDSPFRFPWRS